MITNGMTVKLEDDEERKKKMSKRLNKGWMTRLCITRPRAQRPRVIKTTMMMLPSRDISLLTMTVPSTMSLSTRTLLAMMIASIEDDLLENDTSIDEPGVHQYDKEQQVQNPSIEEFVHEVPAMKQDWAFQDDAPEDEIDDMTKQEEKEPFQEEGSLLENEKWSFLPEYATSTQELEQALQDEVEPEGANKDRGDQETENKFEVFFSSEEWRRDLATEEQRSGKKMYRTIPSYEPREDAPEDEQEYGKDCVIETFEKSRTVQPTMLCQSHQK